MRRPVSDKTLRTMFKRLNKRYFDNKLVRSVKFEDPMEFDESGDAEGVCTCDTIELDKALKLCGVATIEIVLLHEMVHADMYEYRTHGLRFQSRIMDLINQGAYDDLL